MAIVHVVLLAGFALIAAAVGVVAAVVYRGRRRRDDQTTEREPLSDRQRRRDLGDAWALGERLVARFTKDETASEVCDHTMRTSAAGPDVAVLNVSWLTAAGGTERRITAVIEVEGGDVRFVGLFDLSGNGAWLYRAGEPIGAHHQFRGHAAAVKNEVSRFLADPRRTAALR
jgi:hypothetical protein